MDNLQNRLVLIVDDEEKNIYALANYLEAIGMNVETAQNGEEAIEKLQAGLKPDVILLDMMMPVMDGYETLDVLRRTEKFNYIPVMAVTARAMKGDYEKCMEAGAWDYMSKPINMNKLIDKLSE